MTNVAKERKLSRLRGNLARQEAAIVETEAEIAQIKDTDEYKGSPNRNKYLSVLTKLATKLNRQRENRDDTLAMIEAFEYPNDDPSQLRLEHELHQVAVTAEGASAPAETPPDPQTPNRRKR